MTDLTSIAQQTAEILLTTKAVNIRPEEPFTLTSGAKSPVYVDCRKLISFPKERAFLIDSMAQLAKIYHTQKPITSVAGGETAGIPYAALVAAALDLPMTYIRKKPKGFGKNNQIEGLMSEKDHVLLIEDLTTDGGSKHVFVEAIEKTGASIDDVLVVFSYGLAPKITVNGRDVNLHSLATWDDIFTVGQSKGLLTAENVTVVKDFLKTNL